MLRNLGLILCLSAVLSTSSTYLQAQSTVTTEDTLATTTNSPVAYVYVASTPKNSSTNEIMAYAAAANGSLTPVTGSPFMEDVSSIAVNGLYLMAASRATPEINAYNIETDGALTFAASTDYAQFNNDCGVAGAVYFDRTGATLYVQEYYFDCANSGTTSFALDKSTGGLHYLGVANTGAFPGNHYEAYFIGNNVYAYTADNSDCTYWGFYGFKRSSNGLLNNLSLTFNLPTPPAGVRIYVPNQAAADPTNHVAFVMQPANPPGCASGPMQLATYTADASGNLSTTDTYATMPVSSVFSVYDMKMAPSGKLLAVAGQEGLQIFHFNGAKPITKYTGLLTKDPINQMFWDNNNHLYAISQASGKLFVFVITPTGIREAPGSPYKISSPDDIIVQPWPVPWR